MNNIRWIIAVMGIYSCALMYAHRAAMSVAIVRMTKSSSSTNETNNILSDGLYKAPEFDWSQTSQGIVLGSTFYLYWCVPGIAGYFTDRYGGKWSAFVGVLGPCILIALIPSVAQWGFGLLILTQTVIGVFHGFIYPSFLSIFIQWFPARERSRANAGIQMGGALGSTILFVIGGVLCETRIGWPLVFYLLSALHVPWLLLWLYFGDDQPTTSRRINQIELNHLWTNNIETYLKEKKTRKTPWKSILIASPVWCSILVRTAGSFGFYLLYNKTPSYLSTIYELNITKNGYFNACMNLAYCISSFLGPFIANFFINSKVFGLLMTRRLIQTLAFSVPAICMFLMSLARENVTIAMCLLIIGMFFHGLFTGGEWTMISEYAPNLSGSVTGICMLLPFLMGIVAPYIVGVFIDSKIASLSDTWSIIFYFNGGVYIFGVLIFLLISTNQQQQWDKNFLIDQRDENKNKRSFSLKKTTDIKFKVSN